MLRQQTKQPLNLNEQLELWETELIDKGFIANENELLTLLRTESDPLNLSRMLTIAAFSRLSRKKA